MLQLIRKIQPYLLTSNDIVPRTKCPYFYDNPATPKALTNFKLRLEKYRAISSTQIAATGQLPLASNILPMMGDFSMGSFSHTFVGALVVASFGIGDCGECSARLVVEMLANGYGNFTFMGISFPKAKHGMETTHQFIIANLATNPRKRDYSSVYDFFKTLPEDAVIGDPFLGLAFRPNDIPAEFKAYIDAYGKNTQIMQCFHLCNMGPRFLQHYMSVATKITKELQSQQQLSDEKACDLSKKIPIEDTSLIALLKEKTPLPFFGMRDKEYSVDAMVEIKTKEQQIIALTLQDSTKTYGRFFRDQDGRKLFAFDGINIVDQQHNVGEYIQQTLLTK